ncbi:MAG: hypothetical protein E6I88_04030 [Chloroflexi bacterium]|nr:MAG: hypothetical protein E6I88_04030 [Chloroflexota bacterium]
MRYLFVALPRPAPGRRVFRPARRTSWGTRIFVFFVLVLAVGSIGAFLEVFLPQQIASLAKLEGSELQLARQQSGDVNTSVTTLWTDLSRGSIGLSDDQLATDLALAQRTEKSASDGLSHIQAAQAYMAQADGMPFQLHSPGFVTNDRPVLAHLQNSLNAANRLAGAAAVQIPIAQSMNQQLRSLSDLNNSLKARDWVGGARTAATLSAAVKLQQAPAANPETFLDPLWAHWIDATLAVVTAAQQLCLASAQNQAPLAQQDAAILQTARNQMAAAYGAAQTGAAAWQVKTVQPILDKVAHEAAAASS